MPNSTEPINPFNPTGLPTNATSYPPVAHNPNVPTFNLQDPNLISQVREYYTPPTNQMIIVNNTNPFDANALITEDRDFFLNGLNQHNDQSFRTFMGQVNMWDNAGRSGSFPHPPTFEGLDNTKFLQWCASIQSYEEQGLTPPGMETVTVDITPPPPNYVNIPMNTITGGVGGQGGASVPTVQAAPPGQGLSPVGPYVYSLNGAQFYATTPMVTLLNMVPWGVATQGSTWQNPNNTSQTLYLVMINFAGFNTRLLWSTSNNVLN